MIDRGHRLALSRQAELLGISRGSLYYDPCPVSVIDLAIMRRIDGTAPRPDGIVHWARGSADL